MIYFANENGDYWQYDPKFAIYVLDTDSLPAGVSFDPETDYPDVDTIFEYGEPILQSKILDLLS